MDLSGGLSHGVSGSILLGTMLKLDDSSVMQDDVDGERLTDSYQLTMPTKRIYKFDACSEKPIRVVNRRGNKNAERLAKQDASQDSVEKEEWLGEDTGAYIC